MTYLDNAATTYTKPPLVYMAMSKSYANPGRGGHRLSMQAGITVYECRQALAEFFGTSVVESIIFTCNTTEALNLAIKGFLSLGDHVIISSMEHNSVIRPIKAIGASVSIAQADRYGRVTPNSISEHIKKNTKLIVVTHASNLTGTINDIRAIGQVAKDNGIKFLVDAAQTAGVVPIDVANDNIDMLAFAGHKLLFGAQGTGGLYIAPNIKLRPLKEGGTGSLSEQVEQPDFLPDRFESGTLNTGGIAALHEGIRFINRIGLDLIYEKEQELIRRLLQGLRNIEGVRIYGPASEKERVGVVSFNIKNMDSVEVCNELSERYNIAARAGMHCASLAHKTMGTTDIGMIRFSVSWFTTQYDVDKAIRAITLIAK